MLAVSLGLQVRRLSIGIKDPQDILDKLKQARSVLVSNLGSKAVETREDNQVVRDAAAMALWIAKALAQSGFKADFTIESLREIDRFLEQHSAGGVAKAGGLLSQDLGKRIFGLGAYCGEVVRRILGGSWSVDPADPAAEMNIELKTASGIIIWPVQRVMKRFQRGPEEGLFVWGHSLTSPRS